MFLVTWGARCRNSAAGLIIDMNISNFADIVTKGTDAFEIDCRPERAGDRPPDAEASEEFARRGVEWMDFSGPIPSVAPPTLANWLDLRARVARAASIRELVDRLIAWVRRVARAGAHDALLALARMLLRTPAVAVAEGPEAAGAGPLDLPHIRAPGGASDLFIVRC